MQRARPGYVYVMHSPGTARDLYKIGLTASSSEDRAALVRRANRISSATGAPGKYSVVREHHFEECFRAEAWMHEILKEYRYYNEFFWLPNLDLVDAAFTETRSKLWEYGPSERESRGRILFQRDQVGRWAYDIQINSHKEALLDYVEGIRLMRHSPAKGERMLLRSAGRLLPDELAPYPEKVTLALRRLGEFHARGVLFEPHPVSRPWLSHLEESALSFTEISKARVNFTLAGQEGDFIAWGLLGQHLLAIGENQGAWEAFAAFSTGFAEAAKDWQRLNQNIYSPPNQEELGYVPSDSEVPVKILSSFASKAKSGKLSPLPEQARRVLLPLLEDSIYFRTHTAATKHYRVAVEGLKIGPEFDYDLPSSSRFKARRYAMRIMADISHTKAKTPEKSEDSNDHKRDK